MKLMSQNEIEYVSGGSLLADVWDEAKHLAEVVGSFEEGYAKGFLNAF